MSKPFPEELFVRDARVNAAISWVLAAALVVAAVVSFLDGRFVGTVLAGVAAAVAIVPAVVRGSWTVTVPWPLLLLASLPLWIATAAPTLFTLFVSGLSVAALAMLVVVVLHMTTSVRMTPGFAVFFDVIATLAFAGFWAVGSAFSARYLGTAFVETNDELMIVFSIAALAGLLAGVTFRWYFRRALTGDRTQRPAGGRETV